MQYSGDIFTLTEKNPDNIRFWMPDLFKKQHMQAMGSD